jgi:hypothetical protein
MHDHGGVAHTLFVVANLAIAAGYLSVPFLVLPYLPISRAVLIAGAGFFLGCMGSHLWMAYGHGQHTNWFWTAEHLVQAACTWAFILLFRHHLRRAHALRRQSRGPT